MTRRTRAFPEASQIPIRFAEAPGDSEMLRCVEALETGATLEELADNYSVAVGDSPFPVTAALLRIWLIGAFPTRTCIQRLKGEQPG